MDWSQSQLKGGIFRILSPEPSNMEDPWIARMWSGRLKARPLVSTMKMTRKKSEFANFRKKRTVVGASIHCYILKHGSIPLCCRCFREPKSIDNWVSMYRSIETWRCESAALCSNIIYIAEEQWENSRKLAEKVRWGSIWRIRPFHIANLSKACRNPLLQQGPTIKKLYWCYIQSRLKVCMFSNTRLFTL
jgi:hypothetical protein